MKVVLKNAYERSIDCLHKYYFCLVLIFSIAAAISITETILSQFSYFPFIYALFCWFLIRSIGVVIEGFVIFNISRSLSLSLSFFMMVLILSLLGFLNIALPLLAIAMISSIDIVIFGFKTFGVLTSKAYTLFVSLLTAAGLFLIVSGHGVQTPWFHLVAQSGVGYADTLRDAAILQSWWNYNVVSHGTHGLIFTPYHSLFSQFLSPFMSYANGNALSVINNFSFIVLPGVLIYGIFHLVETLGHEKLQTIHNKINCIVFFIFTYSTFQYAMAQRSTSIASLLTVAAIPLLIDCWTNRKASMTAIILLGSITLIMMYARAFHGLVLLGVFGSTFFLTKRIAIKAVIALFSSLCIVFLLVYYGQVERNSGLYLFSPLYLWTTLSIHYSLLFRIALIGYPLIFLTSFLVYIACRYKKTKEGANLYKLALLTLTFVFFLNIACLKAKNLTDAFYSSIIVGWVVFFVLISKDFFSNITRELKRIFEDSLGINIEYKSEKNRLRKSFLYFFIFLIAVFILKDSFYKIKSSLIKQTRILNSLEKIDLDKVYISKSPVISLLRKKVLKSKYSLEYLSTKTYPYQILTKYSEANKIFEGNLGLYISPQNKYWTWSLFSHSSSPSLYSMALVGAPLVYGVNNSDSSYNFKYIKKRGGTLKQVNVKDSGEKKKLCLEALKINLSGVFFCPKNIDQCRVIECSVYRT